MDFSYNGVYNNPSQLNDVDSSACDNSQCMRITSVYQGQAQEDHLIEITTHAENIHPCRQGMGDISYDWGEPE